MNARLSRSLCVSLSFSLCVHTYFPLYDNITLKCCFRFKHSPSDRLRTNNCTAEKCFIYIHLYCTWKQAASINLHLYTNSMPISSYQPVPLHMKLTRSAVQLYWHVAYVQFICDQNLKKKTDQKVFTSSTIHRYICSKWGWRACVH